MNLGLVRSQVSGDILFWAALLSLAIVIAIRLFKKIRVRWLLAMFVGFVLISKNVGGRLYFEETYKRRHLAQNEFVPKNECIFYRPHSIVLHAAFAMTRIEYDDWVATHPWQISPDEFVSQSSVDYDAEQLGFFRPEAISATEQMSSGKQLRTYFKDGVMYLAYYAM